MVADLNARAAGIYRPGSFLPSAFAHQAFAAFLAGCFRCPVGFSFRDGDFDIYTIRPDGSGLKRLTSAPGNDAHSVWSPERKHILFSSSRFGFKDEAPLYDDVPQPYAELFVMNADGTNQRPLTDNQWEDGTPAWAPISVP